MCEYVIALWPGTLGPRFYCPGKYNSTSSECNADALCVWSTKSAKCESDEYLTRAAAELSAVTVNQGYVFLILHVALRCLLILCRMEGTSQSFKLPSHV